jgi:hypothetical protein
MLELLEKIFRAASHSEPRQGQVTAEDNDLTNLEAWNVSSTPSHPAAHPK